MLRLKLVLLSLIIFEAHAQQKYWIYTVTPEDEKKIPLGITSVFCSDWIKACSYELTETQVTDIKESGLDVQPVQRFYYKKTTSAPTLGFALEQINGHLLRAAGLNGNGVKIGIIDGGFGNPAKDPSLNHLTEHDRIISFQDYFNDEATLENAKLNDSHGGEVLQLVAGYQQERDILFGLATHANFYLARTDTDGFERRLEEDYLISALEWMYEEGVEIINISLGYSRGFTDKHENYQPEQMDGKTTAVARAVEHATLAKGLLIVVAAGNEANKVGWRILSSPGDAEHALTVGSSKFNIWEKANFSSTGPGFIDYIKPDVVVFSGTGTSYSAPVITGLAACIRQFNPEYSNLQIMDIIQRSGHLYPYPNNYLGYGVPTCDNILKIMNNQESQINRPQLIRSRNKIVKLNLEYAENRIILLHKDESKMVIKRSILKPGGMKIKIRRYKRSECTTVIYDHNAIEIKWYK